MAGSNQTPSPLERFWEKLEAARGAALAGPDQAIPRQARPMGTLSPFLQRWYFHLLRESDEYDKDLAQAQADERSGKLSSEEEIRLGQELGWRSETVNRLFELFAMAMAHEFPAMPISGQFWINTAWEVYWTPPETDSTGGRSVSQPPAYFN